MMLVAIAAMTLGATAQNGAPHTVTATTALTDVTLSWKAPASPITLQWHDDSSYNGMDGIQATPGGTAVFYAANKFTPADLTALVGQQIKSISFFDYRHVYKMNVQIYEDNVLVVDQPADLTNYTKNTFVEVALPTPYTVTGDKTLLIVARYESGPNFSMVANTDRYPTPGKGDIYSYDGKTWLQGGVGDFMVTANFTNNCTDEPQGYNVYRDGVKVNEELLTGTSTTLASEPAGTHSYVVAAVYADGEKNSAAVTGNPRALASLMPGAATFTGVASELNGTLSWQAPLQGGTVLTWCGDEMGQSIGGTASSNTKVWIKQEFDSSDLLAYKNYQINNIQSYISENTITAVTIAIFKNGVVDYSEVVSADAISAIQTPAWNTFTLTTPYVMEPGNTYAYALYYLHTAKTHPVGVDNTVAVVGKGNCFSVTSASSTFKNSKPTWKTLTAGNIAGNFMLKADVTPVGEATAVVAPTGYDLYRNGELLAAGLTAMEYDDEVDEPGYYEYSLVTKYDGLEAPESSLRLQYTMPEAYNAPLITSGTFDKDTKQVSIAWNASATELSHHGTAAYKVGFDEDMTMLYGAKFTKEELAPYVGYKFSTLNFCVGEDVPFSLEVRTGSNEVLYSYAFEQGDITPVAYYTLTPGEDIVIPEGQDLYLCYNMTAAGGTDPIILDAGPLVDGGAMISLAAGASWMKLGTINSTYNNYNIVVGGTIIPAGSQAPAQGINLGHEFGNMESITISAEEAREAAVTGLGVESTVKAVAPARVKKAAATPVPARYQVLRNREVIAETTESSFSEVLNLYGTFNYNVVTVFENGWKSAYSKTVTVENIIDQNAPAPFDLRGEGTQDGTLELTWDAPGLVQEFTYQKDYSSDVKIGMTGSTTREGYHTIRFSADTIANFVGQKITHIKFKLAEDVTTAAVVVTYGENVIYEQEIPDGEFQAGWNVIRLNTPYVIPENAEQEIGVGYHITYPSGGKPVALDPTPAIPLYSDIISSSGAFGYWYSLKTRFSQDYTNRISAVMQMPDTQASRRVARKAEATVTYNVYCDGTLVADQVTETAYDVLNAAYGDYTVTAVTDGVESAPSNVVTYTRNTGVSDLNAGKTVQSVRYYNATGIEATTPHDGINIVVTTYTDGTKAASKLLK